MGQQETSPPSARTGNRCSFIQCYYCIAAEVWKWIEVNVDFPYGHTHHLRKLEGAPLDLNAEEQATIEALQAKHAKLEAEYENADELPDEVDARLGEIETGLAAFEDRPTNYDPAEIAGAGVFVSIDSDGSLSVDRGYVHPEDEPPATADTDGEPEREGRADRSSVIRPTDNYLGGFFLHSLSVPFRGTPHNSG